MRTTTTIQAKKEDALMHVDNRRKINANLIKEIGGEVEVNAENQLRGSGNDTII